MTFIIYNLLVIEISYKTGSKLKDSRYISQNIITGRSTYCVMLFNKHNRKGPGN